MAAKKSNASEPINLVQFLKLVDQKWATLSPALIACLGAAQVKWHTAQSAQALMAAYQAKYSRRWAFQEELASFGFHYQKKRK